MFNIANYWLELGGLASNGFFSRNNYFQIGSKMLNQDYDNFRKKYKNTDIYQCRYFYESKDIDNCLLYGGFYLDLDGDINTDNGYENLKMDVSGVVSFFKSIGLTDDEILIYFSGSKGFHIEIPANVLGIIPSKNLNLLFKNWALYFHNMLGIKNIDLKIYDRRRLFRISNSINSKTGLYKKRVSLNQVLEYNHNEMCDYAKDLNSNTVFQPVSGINKQAAVEFYKRSCKFYENENKVRPQPKQTIPEEKKPLLPCVDNLLTCGVTKGGRNNTLVLLSSAILQSGYSLEETMDIAANWNLQNDPPLEDRELSTTVKSAYSMLLAGKKYGCTAFKELGYCIGDKCKMMGENLNARTR